MDDKLYFLYLFIIHQLQHSHAIYKESISVEMYSRGFDQSQTYGELSYVKIDGSANLIEPHTDGGGAWTYRGHNVVLINQINGQVLDSISFDTCHCATSRQDAVFSAYLTAISNDTIVAITTFDDGDDVPGATDILSSWGCSLPALGHREAFMFIGTANTRSTPSWQTCIISAQSEEPIHRLFDIPLTMKHPTTHPTDDPSTQPTESTSRPTTQPTPTPTGDPTTDPTSDPSIGPTSNPSTEPSSEPSTEPTTALPTTANPTTRSPTTSPTTNQPTTAVPSVAPSTGAEQQIHSFTTTLTATEAYNDALQASFVEKYKYYIIICVFMVLLLMVLFVLCKLSRAKIKNTKTDSIQGYNVQRHSRQIQLSNVISSSELSPTPPQPVRLQKVCSISMMQNDAIHNMPVVDNKLIDVVLDVMPNKNDALFVGTTPNGKELDEGMARIANVRKEGSDENDMQIFQDMDCIQDTIGNIKNDEFVITDDDDIQTSK